MKIKSLDEYRVMLEEEGLLAEYGGSGFGCKVEDISYNSMLVKEGTIFICKGANFKAQYLEDALAKGACGYIAERDMNMGPDVPFMIVKDMRRAISRISAMYLTAAGMMASRLSALQEPRVSQLRRL